MTEQEARAAYEATKEKEKKVWDELNALKALAQATQLARIRAEAAVGEAIYGVPGLLMETKGSGRRRPRLKAIDAEGNALYRADTGTVYKKMWSYWIRKPDGEVYRDFARGQPKAPAGRWKHVEVEL